MLFPKIQFPISKIRRAELDKIPYTLVIGQKEAELQRGGVWGQGSSIIIAGVL